MRRYGAVRGPHDDQKSNVNGRRRLVAGMADQGLRISADKTGLLCGARYVLPHTFHL
jgi:hypothetical protein